MAAPSLKAITVARRPLDGTYAANIRAHGCGGLNIDACRIGTVGGTTRTEGSNAGRPRNTLHGGNFGVTPLDAGRWPANLILAHLPECAPECAPGCPVTELDRQGADPEGVSRFFKEVGRPVTLTDYLRSLITPVDGDVRILPLEWRLPKSIKDGSGLLHGIIALGTPTVDQAAALAASLRPGGYLLLIAPEDEPTGHTGACHLEDAGLEIRDSILLVLGPGFWYVPKPTRAERDAGCSGLPARTGAEAVDREEGSAGTRSPRAGAGRTATTVRNHHPTVKPAALMARLIGDAGGTVLDPFMGSGSTGVGAVLTGHDFIGVEQEAEYLAIADARIRHWADSEWRGRTVEVSSDHEAETPVDHELDLADLFGFGEGP
jgi:hypothetical protein